MNALQIDGRVAVRYRETDPYGDGEDRTVDQFMTIGDAIRLRDELTEAIRKSTADLVEKSAGAESETKVLDVPSAEPNGPHPEPEARMDELAMIIRRFVHKCRKANIEAQFCDLTMDYLRRKGLQGSPLRGDGP